MAIAVQKYIKNMAKSVAYSTTDVLSKKFEYINDFKNENQEVFNEVYSSIKDYRTTFTRVKKAITNNKVVDAARVGYDSVLYSIRTGDFYAKNKENEVIEKYGGALMENMDIDDEDFDWDNEDISTGEKVIATAVKKNSKIGTALTVEAIAETGKAQMDVAKENTMLLYTQNERLLNKLDGGFQNIMGFLKQNGEQTAKVQNQMNENLNKFMTNVDNNIMKLTKQMDELLEMQRKMYNPTKEEQKNRIGYDDIISRNGVLNIKEYVKQVKKQAFNTINEKSGNMLSMLFGDTMGEGSNLLANFAAAPFRSIMETMANKVLGGSFDKATSQLNTTLEGLIPSIMAKLNATSKKEDAGILGILGKIFGIKDGSNESINTGSYNKGAIPFDGITKRAITDVIPYYLRKMTSAITGSTEMIYDYNTGRWNSMQNVKHEHERAINSELNNNMSNIIRIIESQIGERNLSNAFSTKELYDRYMEGIKSYTKRLQAIGDFGSLKESDLSSIELEIHNALRHFGKLTDDSDKKDRRFIEIKEGNKVKKRIDSGKGRSFISAINGILRQNRLSQNNTIKNINEGNSILRLIDAENLAGIKSEDYHGKDFTNKSGDYKDRYIQEMPISQALLKARDEYGKTIYEYLRDMGLSLKIIKANSLYLSNLEFNNSDDNGSSGNSSPSPSNDNKQKWKDLYNSGINYEGAKDDRYVLSYYESKMSDNKNKEKESYNEKIKRNVNKAREKGKSYILATTTDFSGDDDNIGLKRFSAEADNEREAKAIIEYNNEQKKLKDERWKKIANWLGKDDAKKLREISDKFDPEKGFKENMEAAKDSGFTANLMMFSKVLSNKINNPVEAASDAILKVDFWLQKLIYGEDLKEDEKKKSLFENLKIQIQNGFKWITNKLDDGFEWFKKKSEPIFKPFKKIGEFFFGKKNDEDNIHEGGLFGNFIGGIQKGLRKNAEEVKDYIKREKEEAARKLKESLKANGEDTDDDDEISSSSSSSSSSTISAAERRRRELARKREEKRSKIMSNYERAKQDIYSENEIISQNAMEHVVNMDSYLRRQSKVNGEHFFGNKQREENREEMIISLESKIQRQESSIEKSKSIIERLTEEYNEAITNNDVERAKELENKINNEKNVLKRTEDNLKKNKKKLESVKKSKVNTKYLNESDIVTNSKDAKQTKLGQKTELIRNIERSIQNNQIAFNNLPQNLVTTLEQEIEKLTKSIEDNEKRRHLLVTNFSTEDVDEADAFAKKLGILDSIIESDKTKLKNAKSRFDINKSKLGDESLNNLYNELSDKITADKERIKNVRKTMATGGVNRTGKAFQSVLSGGEKLNGFTVPRTGIYTINPGDVVVNPAPASVRSKQAQNERRYLANIKRNANANDGLSETDTNDIELLTNRDWRSLEDNKQRAEFLGSVASRGLIGGGLGLLVGGPLLGAAVGAASSLTKSTDAFSSFIFGSAIRDNDDNIQIDNKGNVVRNDDGLISREIMKAMPDIKRLGISGAIAGLITPLGPLGGILAGSALGFAKNAEMFQGSLFGDTGIFSDKNMKKLKKGALNMGIGAAISAFAGPFGLIPNALIGATAGYVTSTDKFKDAVLGEKIDPNDPNSKREGGVIGKIKNELIPLKDFGIHLRDNILDEIFGKKDNNGKREGGIFGAIKNNMVTPMIQGGKSIFQELSNNVSDLAHLFGDIYKKFKASTAGNNLLGGLIEKADKLSNIIIKGTGKVTRFATLPFRLLGDDGIGGYFKKKRIRKGKETDLTATERLAFRGKHKMAINDDYSDSDKAMSDMSQEDLSYLLSLIDFNEDENYFEKEKNKSYELFGKDISQYINRKNRKQILKLVKQGRYADAEKVIRTLKISDDSKTEVQKMLNNQISKIRKLGNIDERIKSEKKDVGSILREKGIYVDINDSKKARYLRKQLNREIAHRDSGYTEEELEWKKQREFWTGEKSPLKEVNTNTNNIEKILNKIYHDMSYGREYDKLSDDEKRKYESREDYINKRRSSVINNAVINNSSSDEYVLKQSKIGKFEANQSIIRNAMGNLKVDSEVIQNMIDKAGQIFDSLVLAKLADKDAVKSDINITATQIANAKGISIEDATKEAINKLVRIPIVVVEGGTQYFITSITYSISKNGELSPNLTSNEEKQYNKEKGRYIQNYIKSHVLATNSDTYTSISDMIKKALKISKTSFKLLKINLTDIITFFPKNTIKIAKKVFKKGLFEAKRFLGSHELDNEALTQKILNDRYRKSAEREWHIESTKYMREYSKFIIDKNLANEDEMLFIDKITEMVPDLSSKRFGELPYEEKKKVKEKFISMYIQAKKDKQVFGRGLIGGIKKTVKNITSAFSNAYKNTKAFFNIIANADGDRAKAKEKFYNKKRKEAEKKWDEIFSDTSGKLYQKIIIPIVNTHFGSIPFSDLSDDEKNKVREIFINVYCDNAYNKALYGGNTIFEKVANSIYNIKPMKLVSDFIRKSVEKRIDKNKQNKANNMARKLLNSRNVSEYLPIYNSIAKQIFKKEYTELTDEQQETVNLEYYNQYKNNGGFLGSIGYKINSKLTKGKRLFGDKTTETLKSGIRNSVNGRLDNVRKYKEKQQEQDTFIGKIFNKLDTWAIKRDQEKITGKKDSKFAKIMKAIFTGGVIAPIIVGFIKKEVMPAIHEKIQPWLKKAGEKLVGVKNPQTGEYEGGIVSGIVNPIKKFFGDKFKNIHDWFANEGKYKSNNVGLQGLLSNIKGIGEYIIELWKAGSATIYGEWLPKIFEKIGENFIPGALKATKSLLEGFGKFMSKLFKGQEGAKIETDFSATGTSDTIKTQGKTIELNNGFGKKIYLQVPSVSAKVNPNFNIGSKTNSDGTKTFTNGNESITSQKINDYDMYYVNTTPTGKPVYVNKKNNIKYIKDEETKTYIPLSEFQKKMNNDLNDNIELQNFIDAENASELHPGFADPNASTRRMATTTSRLAGTVNNFRILGSGNNSKIMNAMRGISEVSSSAIKKIPFLGNKLNFIKRGLEKAIVGGSKLTTKLQSKVYTKSGKLVEGILGFTKKIKGKFTKTLMKLFKSEKVSKLLGKVFKENSEKIAKQIEFKITKLIEKNADEIAKLSGKYSAKTMARIVPFISVVANFILGMDDCRNILGIVSENPALSERIVAGLLNAFPDILISVAGLLTASVAASIVGGALAIAGILGVILLSIPEMRSQLIDGILDVLDTFGIDTSGIRKKRQDAVEAVGAFNEVNKTSITLEEYNNLMNPSNARKIFSAGANIWSATFGYDSATKGDVNAISSAVKGANKYAEKVRKKLNTVVSSIWQHFGKDDFNYSEAVDGEGNELTGKKKLNVNNLKFTSLMGNIISELITLLNNEDEQVAMDVYSNVTDLTGFYDSRSRLKKLYKEGKNNPKSQFDISDEHATFKRIRAIAGICSIFNYVFKPLGKQYDVTSIIVSKLIPAYFTSSESDTEVIDWANETYYQVDVSKYEANNNGNEVYGPQLPNIAMNANTNNGLSPISTKSNGIGEIFVNMINKSIGKLTGNFDKVEELFTSLTNKNKSINDSIDKLTILPNNKKYWKIELDKQNPFLSGLYNFIETMNRVVKAPIALASASLGGTLSTLSSSTSTTTPSNNNNSNTINNDNKTNNNSGVLTKLTTGAKSIGKTMLKTAMSWFGFGKGKDDPYHIYQRDYNGSYRTSGDTENQTIADSGCGPAAAASLLRMYGKNGDIHNAANYAMNNKYKEVNGGTYPQFFNDYLNKNGISTNSSANNTDVINNLVHNKPVILMGRDMNNSGRTPYGSKYSHYVVARGLDSNGNVIVEDSEDKNGSTRYSLADTLKNSSVKITTGTGKYGRAKESTTSSTGLLGLIGKYSNTITKGIFRDFYDALYGNETNNSSSNNTNTTSSFSGSLAEGDAESNMKAMFSYMKSQGFSDNLAAGILGNIKEESGFDPHIIEGGGSGTITEKMSGGYGLAQWTSPSSRACLYNWCTANNCNPESLEGQTKWIVAQIKGINISDEANPNNASMFNGATGQGTMSYNWSLFKARGTFDTFNTYSIEKAVRLWLECAERPADISGAAIRRTKYAKEILAACTSGSGRGKKFINNISNNPKYGRSVWGRDGEEETNNTSTSLTNKISEYSSKITEGVNNANEKINTVKSSSSNNSDSKSLISKLTDYATTITKNVYSDFYEALYGSTTTESNNNTIATGNSNDIVYAAAMIFEANQHVNPNFVYQLSSYPTFICKDGTKIDKVLTDCSGMMTATVQYLGYYTPNWSGSYTDTYHGNNMTVTMFHEKQENGHPANIKNADGQIAQEFTIMDYPGPSGLQPGDMIIYIGAHMEMYIYTDSNGDLRGFNAGSTNGMRTAVPLAEYIIENGTLPDASACIGSYISAENFEGRKADIIIRYNSGGSGRGKNKVNYNRLNSISKKIPKPFYNKENPNGTSPSGRGVLKSFDDVRQNNRSYTNTGRSSRNVNGYNSNNGITVNSNGSISNTSIDLNQLIGLINVIANNADKMDAVLQLLGTIATNTENTTTAVTNKNNNTSPKNGLSALRSALDSNGSGMDIVNAVYQIAKS